MKDFKCVKTARYQGTNALICVMGRMYKAEKWSTRGMTFVDETGKTHIIDGSFFKDHFEEVEYVG